MQILLPSRSIHCNCIMHVYDFYFRNSVYNINKTMIRNQIPIYRYNINIMLPTWKYTAIVHCLRFIGFAYYNSEFFVAVYSRTQGGGFESNGILLEHVIIIIMFFVFYLTRQLRFINRNPYLLLLIVWSNIVIAAPGET